MKLGQCGRMSNGGSKQPGITLGRIPKGNVIFGWFDDTDQTVPSHDPPHDAPCLFCGSSIHAEDVRTHSLIYTGEYAARSYFYRTHRTCADRDSKAAMDGIVLDMISRSGT
jgi:hypothetical protein